MYSKSLICAAALAVVLPALAQDAVEAVAETAEAAVQDSIVVNNAEAAPALPPAPVADEPAAEPPAVAEAPIVEQEPAPLEAPAVEAPSVDDVIAVEPSAVSPPVVHAHPALACCPVEVVDTRTRISARRLYRRAGAERSVSVCVENPACKGKLNQVPLCVPCCVQGSAQVCNPRCGLLGRGKVDLVWHCGFTATVTFLPCGDAIVTYSAS